MCKSPLHAFLQALPKCEHHLHIEGTASPELIFRLAAKNGVELPSPSVDPSFASPAALRARFAQSFSSLDEFLSYYYVGFSVLVTVSDFAELAYEYLSRVADPASPDYASLRHAELSFDPQAHTSRGVPYETVVKGLTEGRRRAERDFGISTALVMCFLRHLPVDDAGAHLRLAAATRNEDGEHHFEDGTLAGIGLDSSELPYPPAMFAPLYAEALALGVPRFTAHAGEEGPASFVEAALDLVPREDGSSIDSKHLRRIDHGIRAAEYPLLLARLARDGVVLTICPLSNVSLGAVPSVGHLPFRTLMGAGVRFSINSDDPAYFTGGERGTAYLQDCYCAVENAFTLSVDEWWRIAHHGVEASWVGEERKRALMAEVDAVVEEWRGKLDAMLAAN